ncbi:MAG: hypothetical protein ACHQ1D_12350, partial [Nitrososphaerales archaeon]
MNLRSKRNSSKHDFACADASVSGEPATRQPPELDERHPGECNSKVEAGASAFYNGTRIGGKIKDPDDENNSEKNKNKAIDESHEDDEEFEIGNSDQDKQSESEVSEDEQDLIQEHTLLETCLKQKKQQLELQTKAVANRLEIEKRRQRKIAERAEIEILRKELDTIDQQSQKLNNKENTHVIKSVTSQMISTTQRSYEFSKSWLEDNHEKQADLDRLEEEEYINERYAELNARHEQEKQQLAEQYKSRANEQIVKNKSRRTESEKCEEKSETIRQHEQERKNKRNVATAESNYRSVIPSVQGHIKLDRANFTMEQINQDSSDEDEYSDDEYALLKVQLEEGKHKLALQTKAASNRLEAERGKQKMDAKKAKFEKLRKKIDAIEQQSQKLSERTVIPIPDSCSLQIIPVIERDLQSDKTCSKEKFPKLVRSEKGKCLDEEYAFLNALYERERQELEELKIAVSSQ